MVVCVVCGTVIVLELVVPIVLVDCDVVESAVVVVSWVLIVVETLVTVLVSLVTSVTGVGDCTVVVADSVVEDVVVPKVEGSNVAEDELVVSKLAVVDVSAEVEMSTVGSVEVSVEDI